jgi:hypothetical protein
MYKIFAFNRSLAAAAALLLSALAAQADIVRQYPACNGECVFLPSGFGGDFTARTIRFSAPSRGTLLLSFHGTLHCSNNATFKRNVAVYSQIVPGNAIADPAGPSGLDFFASLEASDNNTRSKTFNLASTRVFTIRRRGARVYRFRLHRFGIEDDASCSVRNGAFLVDFRR